MRRGYREIIIVFLFAFLSIFIFREYFFGNKIPFSSNLLVSYYEPWASYRFPDYPNGPPSKPIGFDNLRIFYPLRKLTIDQFKNWQFPLWNPYNFSGNTQLATYQSAVFHPLSFLFLILPQIDAWSIVVILIPFFSSLFMFLFLREISLGSKSSFFGAITFAFSGFMIVWWEECFMSSYAALFLPLILFSIEKIFKKKILLGFYILTLGLSFSLLSGWFQMTLYVYVFSLIWIIYRLLSKYKDLYSLLYFFTSYILSILISGIHLIPSVEAYLYSARGTTDAKFIFDTYLVSLKHLITFLAPDFFGNPATHNYFGGGSFYYEKVIFIGIPALFFAIYEFISKSNLLGEKFFKATFLVALSLGFSLPTSWFFLYSLKLPLISVILPSRIFFLSTFSISVLAAFGMERLIKKQIIEKKAYGILLTIFVVLIFMLIYAFYLKINLKLEIHKTVPLKNLILPFAVYFVFTLVLFMYFRLKNFQKLIFFSIIFISISSFSYFANKYLYFSERKFVYPEVPVIEAFKKNDINRFWGVGSGYFERNFATQFSLFSPEGYDSFYIGRYGELLYAGQNNGKFSKQIPRTDATISGIKNLNEIFDNFYRERLLSLLGVRFIIAGNNNTNEKDLKNDLSFKTLWKDNFFTIYENKKAFPRAVIFSDYVVLKNEQQILDRIFDKNMDLSNTIILEEEPSGLIKKGIIKDSKIQLISYKLNKIIFKEEVNQKAIFYLSDNYYPGWKAYIDGKKTKIYRANYSFRAVVVPSGKHNLVFEYKPLSFYLGLLSSIFGLLIFFIVGFKIKTDKPIL